jgi:DNA-binding FrmR family transcriptional regulator
VFRAQKKTNALIRVRRILSKIEALERRFEDGNTPTDKLQAILAIRSSLNGLMGEVIEQHVRSNLVEPQHDDNIAEAGEDLIDTIRRNLK